MAAREGFFCAAYELRRNPSLDVHSRRRLEGLLAWFRAHLPVPDRFNRSSSKGYARRNTKGLSWFKPSAAEVLVRAHDLRALLNEHGHMIDVIKTERIGYVVYEDAIQVVAEPFADTPT